MIRLIASLALLAVLALAGAWVADNPGEVTIFWFGYRIDTSFAFLLAGACVLGIVCAYLFIAARWLVLAPLRLSSRRSNGQYRKGLSALTQSLTALASGDAALAEQHTRKAQKFLGTTPLTLLLAAQTARLRGDDSNTHALLTRMLDFKETEFLAARSLAEAASKQQTYATALPLAQRAHEANPKERHAALALTSLQLRAGQWQEALGTLARARRKGALARSESKQFEGLVMLQQAEHLLNDSRSEAALATAQAALKRLGHFVPAIVLVARSFIAAGKPEAAMRLVLMHWKECPHPELAATLRIAIAKLPPEQQMKQAKRLTELMPGHPESQLALAETAIKCRQWDVARTALKPVLDSHAPMRACKLMAYVEQGERADSQAANRWLERASEAVPDSAWTCSSCAHRSDHWQASCPQCGSFASMAWKEQAPLVFAP
jgi:HemY protein